MITRRKSLIGAIVLATMAACPAMAHDAPRVETEVVLNAENIVEVTHVLQLSTSQRMLYKAGVIDKNDLSGLKARAQLALYTAERFDLFADDAELSLELLGAEIDGGHVYVYQIGEVEALPSKWSARNAILRDLNPGFDNVINVPTAEGIQTIVFDSSNLDLIKTPS